MLFLYALIWELVYHGLALLEQNNLALQKWQIIIMLHLVSVLFSLFHYFNYQRVANTML